MDILLLDAVIVTALSSKGTLRSVPHGVSVITADDIARSPSTSVTDLLSRAANLNLQSFYGSDKYATVDVRGMGATAGSNVLVLIDGVRRNEQDLSGADLSSIALSEIERIEIVRGGGAVQYGDGAVGGVINIITQRSLSQRPEFDVSYARGSYALRDARAAARGGQGLLAWRVNLTDSHTGGFRDNGDVRSRNASGELRLAESRNRPLWEAFVRVNYHDDHFGFPGPVSAADFAANRQARRATLSPEDGGTTQDATTTAGGSYDAGLLGKLSLQAGYRNRDNSYIIGHTSLLTDAQQRAHIDSRQRTAELRYDNEVELWGMKHTVGAGYSHLSSNYGRYTGGREVADASERKLGNVTSRGGWVSAVLRPLDAWSVTMGYRISRFTSRVSDQRYRRDCIFAFNPDPVIVSCTPLAYRTQGAQGGRWNNHSTELALTWAPARDFTAFAGTTRHFRNPNVDELVLAADDLRPQSGHTIETGIRWSPRAEVELALTLFKIRNDDELYFGADPASGFSQNRNYERTTVRRGGEVEAQWQPMSAWTLRFSAGYVRPRFSGTDADIPLVPRRTANLQSDLQLGERWRWTASVRHVEGRFDGNDQTNRDWPRLPSYTLVDTALRCAWSVFNVTVGVNNMFDRAYSTLAYSATSYPMPERNFYARLGVTF